MAQNSKAGKKSAEAAQEALPPEEWTPAAPPAEEAPVVEAAAAEAPVAEPAPEPAFPEPAAAVAEIAQAPLAVVEEVVETAKAFSASFQFDTSVWPKKSFELWAESAAAFFELAENVARAQSLEEVVDLQSRFASERFEAFVRQSKELMDFAQNVAVLSAAPLCDVRKAA